MYHKLHIWTFVLTVTAAVFPDGVRADVPFLRGDTDGDGELGMSDAIHLLDILFVAPVASACDDAEDANDDGLIDVSDPVSILLFLFSARARLPEPFPTCGLDPTDDSLGCEEASACDCLSVTSAEELITENIPTLFCLEPEEISLGDLAVVVCPADRKGSCGAGQEPGCPIVLTTVEPTLDLELLEIRIGVKGNTANFPIDIDVAAECAVDLSFEGDLIILFFGEEENGSFRIDRFLLDEASLEDVALVIEATGGFLCGFLEAFADRLREFVQPFVDDVAEELNAKYAGTRICRDN